MNYEEEAKSSPLISRQQNRVCFFPWFTSGLGSDGCELGELDSYEPGWEESYNKGWFGSWLDGWSVIGIWKEKNCNVSDQ